MFRVVLSECMQDVRYALRQFQQRLSFSVVTILILALGIGATTAIFSILNSMILRPLPVRGPQRLVTLAAPFRANAGLRTYWSYSIWQQIRINRELFDGAFAWSEQRFNLSDRGEAEPAAGIFVSGDYFTTLGVHATTGRVLNASDDVPGGGPDGLVAVISYELWQRRYAGARDIVGRELSVDGVRFTVVGVMPREFFGTEVGRTIDVAVPLGSEPSIHRGNAALGAPGWYWLEVMLRLKPGQSIQNTNQKLHAIGPGIIQDAVMPDDLPVQFVPNLRSDPFTAVPGITGVSSARSRYDGPISILMVTVTALLIIACANIANLLLARALSRRYEITVRLALGASRWRLMRQTLIESLMLSSISGLLGLSMAGTLGRVLVRQISGPADPLVLDLSIDWRMLVFAMAVSIATAILFGTAPAWTSATMAPIDALNERGRGNMLGGGGTFSSGLVVGQVALSALLIIIAGLFIRTFVNLANVSTGYETNRITLIDLNLRHTPADPSRRLALFHDLVNAAATIPGVEHAAGSFVTPISNTRFGGTIQTPGRDGPTRSGTTFINFVTPGWLATYGLRLRAGRDLDETDTRNDPPVAIVNQAFVRRFLASREPIGETIKYSFNGEDFSAPTTIVGVSSDAVYQSLRDGMQATLYMPIAQWDLSAAMTDITISIRAVDRPSAALTRTVADALTRVYGDMSFIVRPLDDQVMASLARERAIANLSVWFGATALLLASIGLYGVMSYNVNRRRSEIGIRLALGGTPASIMGMVFRHAYFLVLLGVIIGTVVSVWASSFVASLLYEIDPHDRSIIAAAVFALIVAAAIATWLPASRASRTDSGTVLRAE